MEQRVADVAGEKMTSRQSVTANIMTKRYRVAGKERPTALGVWRGTNNSCLEKNLVCYYRVSDLDGFFGTCGLDLFGSG
jgi:hypothetical protein